MTSFSVGKRIEDLYAYGDVRETGLEHAPLRANSSREDLNQLNQMSSSVEFKLNVFADSPNSQTLRAIEGTDKRIAEPNHGSVLTQSKQRHQVYF